MSILAAFNPYYTQGITVSPGSVAADSTVGGGAKALVLSNIGTVTVYVRTFRRVDGVVAATAADYPVLVNTQVPIAKDQDHDSISYIGAAGGSLHIIPGEGV
jgi:hypothetical protein